MDELDGRAGAGQRGTCISALVRRGLENEQRWDDIEAALGQVEDSGHERDDDPASWVRQQRQGGLGRSG